MKKVLFIIRSVLLKSPTIRQLIFSKSRVPQQVAAEQVAGLYPVRLKEPGQLIAGESGFRADCDHKTEPGWVTELAGTGQDQAVFDNKRVYPGGAGGSLSAGR